MPKTAYLAHPIDQAYDTTLLARAVNQLRVGLTRAGYHVYSPGKAWEAAPGAPTDPRIEDINDYALVTADMVVAYLPRGAVTIGVPMEIERAKSLGTPVIVRTDGQTSFALDKPGIHVITDTTQLGDLINNIEADPGRLVATEPAIRVVITPGAEPPTRAYPDDAGVDLTTAREYTVEPGQFIDIHTQVDQVQLPDGYWGMIIGRSSTLRQHRLHVPQAVIDPGWRGPLFVGVWNLGGNPVIIKPGYRLGQLILIPNHPYPVHDVTNVDPSDRGTNGFGSTGV